jgi:hypothetical protein
MRLLFLLNLFMLRGGVYRVIALAFIAGVIGLVGLGIWSLKASHTPQAHVLHGVPSHPSKPAAPVSR